MSEENNFIDLTVGQEWNYDTREGEENSTLKICKIENYDEMGTVYHIAVEGISIDRSHLGMESLELASHLPMEEGALVRSITSLKNDRSALPDYEFGYVQWRSKFENEGAGYFNVPVKDIIELMEESIKNHRHD